VSAAERSALMSRLRKAVPGVVAMFVVAHCAHHLVTALPVPLLPYIRDEFALDYTRAALVISAFSVPYGIAQLPSGWLADRFGARRMVCVGISGVAVAGLLVGLSAHYIVMLVALGLMGALGGGYHPSAPTLISKAVEPERRGRALGLHMIGGSVAYFVAPLVAAGIAVALGWRSAFIVLAVPSAIFGFVFYRVLARRENAEASEAVSAEIADTSADPPVNWPRLVALLVLSCFTAAIVQACLSFIPLLLVDKYGYAEHGAAAAISLFYSTGLWAAVAGGYAADRLGNVRVVAIVALLSGPALVLVGGASTDVMVMALLLYLGVALYARSPASESFILSHSPARHRSTVLGLYYFGAMEGNGVLVPIVGYLVDRFGFATAYTVSGIAMTAVAVVCSLLLLRWRFAR